MKLPGKRMLHYAFCDRRLGLLRSCANAAGSLISYRDAWMSEVPGSKQGMLQSGSMDCQRLAPRFRYLLVPVIAKFVDKVPRVALIRSFCSSAATRTQLLGGRNQVRRGSGELLGYICFPASDKGGISKYFVERMQRIPRAKPYDVQWTPSWAFDPAWTDSVKTSTRTPSDLLPVKS